MAAAAVLGAAASLYMKMKEDGKGAKALMRAASDVRKRLADHAASFGKMTRRAYDSIVETTLAEYKGVKALSAEELAQLKEDLKDGWDEMQKAMKKTGKK